jgi:hypothetical protein
MTNITILQASLLIVAGGIMMLFVKRRRARKTK